MLTLAETQAPTLTEPKPGLGLGAYLAVPHPWVVRSICPQHVVQALLQAGLCCLPKSHIVWEGPIQICTDAQRPLEK